MSTGRVAGRTTSPTQATHYDVLGVAPDASVEQIRARYRSLSKTHHPDAGGTRERFEAVAVAHATLADPKLRAEYDTSLLPDPEPAAQPTMVVQPGQYVADDGQVYFDDDLYEVPVRRQLARLAIYMVAMLALVAFLILYGTAKAEEIADRVWPLGQQDSAGVAEGDAAPVEREPEVAEPGAPVGPPGHNGLGAPDSAKRWLATFQALSGVNPQMTAEDAAGVYIGVEPDAEPGALCRTYTKADFWLSLSSVSVELNAVQIELNHHMSRAVAECSNLDDVVPALSIAFGTDRTVIADRLRKVEQLADEAAYTVSGL